MIQRTSSLVRAIAALASMRVLAETEPTQLVLPHLVADRAAKEVRIEARATGVQGHTQTEFFLIATNSGHDYEAIAVCMARPSDVHRALEFIGLQPGRPVDPEAIRLWPRGPRVWCEIEWKLPTGGVRRVRIEETVLDTRTGQPLPKTGLVFVGSKWIPAPDGTGKVYAADVEEPNSIASAFNLSTTVLDIPRRGAQGALYDYQVANPATVMPEGTPVTVVMRPEPRPDGTPRARDLDLHVSAGPQPDAHPEFRLCEGVPLRELAKGKLTDIVPSIQTLAERGHDLHLTVRVAPDTPVARLRAIGALVGVLAEHPDVRIEPPPPGQLFYRAFTPDPDFRDRAQRPSQPWELRFQRTSEGQWRAILTQVELGRDILTDQPRFYTTDYPADTPEELRRHLDAHGPGLRVIVVFAPGPMKFGDMMRFLAPLTATHPVVHVYEE